MFKKKTKFPKNRPIIYAPDLDNKIKEEMTRKKKLLGENKGITRRDFLKKLALIGIGTGITTAIGKVGLQKLEESMKESISKEVEEARKQSELELIKKRKLLQQSRAGKLEKEMESQIREGINEEKLREFEKEVVKLRKKYHAKERDFLRRISQKEYLNNLAKLIAEALNVNPKLVSAIIEVESDTKRFSRSNAKAYGLMQILPDTEKDIFNRKLQKLYGKEIFKRNEFGLFEPHYNIYLGTIYLKSIYFDPMLKQYLERKNFRSKTEYEKKRLELTIKAYNQGLKNVMENENKGKEYYEKVSFLLEKTSRKEA